LLAGEGMGIPNSDEGIDTVVLQVYMYMFVLCGTASLENLPNTFFKKIFETLKNVRAIFDVFSRYRSIPGEHT
jgi:hypothetical protein